MLTTSPPTVMDSCTAALPVLIAKSNAPLSVTPGTLKARFTESTPANPASLIISAPWPLLAVTKSFVPSPIVKPALLTPTVITSPPDCAVVFSKTKSPCKDNAPANSKVRFPAARVSTPSEPAISSDKVVDGPAAISRPPPVIAVKSTTLPSLAARLIVTPKPPEAMVTSSIPTKLALSALALSAVHLRLVFV